MGENVQRKYCRFKSKNKDELLIILQEVRCLLDEEKEITNSDFVENPGITHE